MSAPFFAPYPIAFDAPAPAPRFLTGAKSEPRNRGWPNWRNTRNALARFC
jgi:hypothetical protein